MSTKTYSAEQLGEVAGVSRRQIRYYIQEGLVGKPLGSTKGSYYTQQHLEDLLAVKRFLEEGYRLDRILAIMQARRGGNAIPAPAFQSQLEVWTHVNLAAGLKLLVDPHAAAIAPEDLRMFIAKVATAYRETIEQRNEEKKEKKK